MWILIANILLRGLMHLLAVANVLLLKPPKEIKNILGNILTESEFCLTLNILPELIISQTYVFGEKMLIM